jgi:hypothetical protein
LSAMVSLALPYFSTLSHKWHDIGGGGLIEHTISALIFSTNFV